MKRGGATTTGTHSGADMVALQGSAGAGESAQVAYQNAQLALGAFVGDAQRYEHSLGKMLDGLRSLVNEAEVLRQHYEEVLGEKAYLEHLVTQADGRLQDVRNIVDRYANVKDAVVASDGYTYERKTITDYINECEQTGSRPKSQRVDVTLTTLLIPNRSLNTLLERLTEARRAYASANSGGGGASPSKSGSQLHNAGSSGSNTGATAAAGGGADVGKTAAFVHDGGSATALAGGERVNGMMSGAVSAAGGAGGSNHHMASGGGGGGGGGRNRDLDRPVELNEKGERVHPCLRVYGHCNYGHVCAYARYPYDACLSHLKGKCRFRTQCHERHVDYRGAMTAEATNTLAHARNGDTGMTAHKVGDVA